MGSIISLSRKSKSSKRRHSKDNRSFSSKIASTSSTLPSGSNDSISGFSDVSTAHSFHPNSTCFIDDLNGQEQINLSLKFESLSSASTVSSISDCQVSNTVSPTKCFFDASTQQRQNFAFPAPIMENIAMNPSSTKVYQKLIQTCKYFFARNPILVISTLFHFNCEDAWHDQSSSLILCPCIWPDYRDGWEFYFPEDSERYSNFIGSFLLKNVSQNFKIWPTGTFHVYNLIQPPANTVSSIIPRIYRSDVRNLILVDTELSLDELKFIAAKAEKFQSYWPSIKDENGADLSLKDIIAVFPKLKYLKCYIRRTQILPLNTVHVQQLISIPQFQNFFKYYFDCNPDAFDIDAFCKFMIDNKNIEYELMFHSFIPQTLKDRIDACEERLANEVYENDQKRPEIIVNKWKQNENEDEAN